MRLVAVVVAGLVATSGCASANHSDAVAKRRLLLMEREAGMASIPNSGPLVRRAVQPRCHGSGDPPDIFREYRPADPPATVTAYSDWLRARGWTESGAGRLPSGPVPNFTKTVGGQLALVIISTVGSTFVVTVRDARQFQC
jgi:hypothetical protein